MTSTRRIPPRLAALASALLWACGDLPAGPEVTIVLDDPADAEIVVGELRTLGVVLPNPTFPVVWSSLDPLTARVEDGEVEALRPGVARVVARSWTGSDTVSITVLAREGGYSAEEVDYFLEISLGFEFGTASRIVRKWGGDVRYQVLGELTAADRAMLDDVVADLNALTATVDLVEVQSNPAVEIHFAPSSQFPSILPSYTPGNIGYFSVSWDASQFIYEAVVLVATEVSQEVRDHIIREEVTQMLGMGRDSFRYQESIFQQEYSLVAEYAPIDEAVIEILYRPEILVGMDERLAGRAARRLLRAVVADRPALADGVARGPAGSASGSAGGDR